VLKGNGTTVFIQGESGIGKTQLISHAVTNFLPPGINTIWGRCLFQEGGLPYHPFVSGIKNSIQPVDDQFISALSHHAGKYGISLSSRIPYLRSFLNLSGEPVALLHKEQLWDSILVLLQVLAGEQPLVLVLDDLQWADKTTLGLFSYITRNITRLPILQIGIYRKDSVFSEEIIDEASLTDTVRQLKIEGIAEQLNLLRLTKQETEKLAFRLFGDHSVEPRLLKKIVKHSEGQPLFVSEMVHLLKEKNHVRWDGNMWRLKVDREAGIVSQRVQDIILQRLDRLGSEQREILEIASCQGEYFNH
jgi:predicted ATPase